MSNLQEYYKQVLSSQYNKEVQEAISFRKSVKKVNATLIFLLAALLLGPLIMVWLLSPEVPKVASVEVKNIRLVSPSELCPGDVIVFAFEFESEGSGVVEVDETTFRVTPPATIVFSATRRFILRNSFSRTVYRSWQIPDTYLDERTGTMVDFAPGQYERIISLSSPHFDSLFTTGTIPFSIRQDCTGG